MTLETKKIPGFNGDRICRRQADSFWTGIWKAEDGRFFIVTDKEIEWFDTQAELLRTIANLMNLGER